VNRESAERIAREARGIPVPVTPASPDLEELVTKAPRVTSTPPWAPTEYEAMEPVENPPRTASTISIRSSN
jgi:hypothetical protein